jgi:hypothetical protein
VGGDSFACVPSLVCRGRVTLLTCFACCAVYIYSCVTPEHSFHLCVLCALTSTSKTQLYARCLRIMMMMVRCVRTLPPQLTSLLNLLSQGMYFVNVFKKQQHGTW